MKNRIQTIQRFLVICNNLGRFLNLENWFAMILTEANR